MRRKHVFLALIFVLLALTLTACSWWQSPPATFPDNPDVVTLDCTATPVPTPTPEPFTFEQVPFYDGDPHYTVNGNQPFFTEEDITTEPFEQYQELDELGRVGVCYANICKEILPSSERGNISSVKPTGWVNHEYEGVDGGYLYNRCHMIGFQLSGENANERNLITGTRYMNVEGMLPYENTVAEYSTKTGNHVLYRVTPDFRGDNLLANGVLIEAYSVEDGGAGICFNVYCYNVQPDITLDYETGENWIDRAASAEELSHISMGDEHLTFVINKNTGKFHVPWCTAVDEMAPTNRLDVNKAKETLLAEGYTPCTRCKP